MTILSTTLLIILGMSSSVFSQKGKYSMNENDFKIEESVLGREIELLILRDLLLCKKEGDIIIF